MTARRARPLESDRNVMLGQRCHVFRNRRPLFTIQIPATSTHTIVASTPKNPMGSAREVRPNANMTHPIYFGRIRPTTTARPASMPNRANPTRIGRKKSFSSRLSVWADAIVRWPAYEGPCWLAGLRRGVVYGG